MSPEKESRGRRGKVRPFYPERNSERSVAPPPLAPPPPPGKPERSIRRGSIFLSTANVPSAPQVSLRAFCRGEARQRLLTEEGVSGASGGNPEVEVAREWAKAAEREAFSVGCGCWKIKGRPGAPFVFPPRDRTASLFLWAYFGTLNGRGGRKQSSPLPSSEKGAGRAVFSLGWRNLRRLDFASFLNLIFACCSVPPPPWGGCK